MIHWYIVHIVDYKGEDDYKMQLHFSRMVSVNMTAKTSECTSYLCSFVFIIQKSVISICCGKTDEFTG